MQEKERYKLGNPKIFHYLNQSNCYELDGVNDGEEYVATRRAMDIVGINEEEQVGLPTISLSFLCIFFRFLTLHDIFPGGNIQGCGCNSSPG